MADKAIQVRRALEDRGLTLTAVAEQIGVTRQSVSKCLRRPEDYPRVRARIVAILGRDPWQQEDAA